VMIRVQAEFHVHVKDVADELFEATEFILDVGLDGGRQIHTDRTDVYVHSAYIITALQRAANRISQGIISKTLPAMATQSSTGESINSKTPPAALHLPALYPIRRGPSF